VSACTVTAAAKTSPIAAESNFATGPFFQHPKSNTADDDNLNITYNNNIPDTVNSPLHPTPSRRCFFVSVSQTRDPLPANVPTFPCPSPCNSNNDKTRILAGTQVPPYPNPNPHLLLMYSRQRHVPLSRVTRYAYYSVDHLHARDSPGLPTTPNPTESQKALVWPPLGRDSLDCSSLRMAQHAIDRQDRRASRHARANGGYTILMCLHSAHHPHPPIHTANSGGRGYNNDLQTPARARRRLGAAPDCGRTRRPAEPMMIKSS
jgi:hypothetical protein